MSIVNRRNAVVGWLTWMTVKSVLKSKVKAAVPGTVEGTRRPNKSAIAAIAAAVGAVWFWRRQSSGGDETPGES